MSLNIKLSKPLYTSECESSHNPLSTFSTLSTHDITTNFIKVAHVIKSFRFYTVHTLNQSQPIRVSFFSIGNRVIRLTD